METSALFYLAAILLVLGIAHEHDGAVDLTPLRRKRGDERAPAG